MKLLKYSIMVFILAAACFLQGLFAAQIDSSFWQTEKSQHFIVYYQATQPGYLSQLTSEAENYYNSIVDDLGFRRFDFWSWDNRAKIYLYSNSDQFLSDTRRQSWAGAVVYPANRTIKTFIGQAGFFDSILPHELTHIIFREFVGTKTVLPLWIDEGVASSQEKSYLNARLEVAKNLVAQNQYIKLDKFSEISNADLVPPNVFYGQSASLVVFLIRGRGRENFQDFCRKIRDGANWKSALLSTYHFNNFDELEQAWKDFVRK
jgi:hypothetical protein